MRDKIKDHFDQNLKLYSSDKLENKILEAIEQCRIYRSVKGSGKRKQNKRDLLLSAGINFFNHLLDQTRYVKLNNYDLDNSDLVYVLDIEDREERQEVKDKIESCSNSKGNCISFPLHHIPVTITATFCKDESSAWDYSRFGWRSVYNNDKELLVYHTQNLPILKALIESGIIEQKIDKYEHRESVLFKPTPKYRINPHYLLDLEDRSELFLTEKAYDRFLMIHKRMVLNYGIGIDENMLEAINLYKLDLNITESELYHHCYRNWYNEIHRGKVVNNKMIHNWVYMAVLYINQFKDYNPRFIARTNGKRYRRTTFFNMLPRAIREYVCIKNNLVQYDASSMHFNNALSLFLQEMGEYVSEDECNIIIEAQGDSKTYFAEKLGIKRSEFGNKLNKYLYQKNSHAAQSSIGKLIANLMPEFHKWTRDIKKYDKGQMVQKLYPMEYNFITSLMVEGDKIGIPINTVHDCCVFPKEYEEQFIEMADRIIDEMSITSLMKKEEFQLRDEKIDFPIPKDVVIEHTTSNFIPFPQSHDKKIVKKNGFKRLKRNKTKLNIVKKSWKLSPSKAYRVAG